MSKIVLSSLLSCLVLGLLSPCSVAGSAGPETTYTLGDFTHHDHLLERRTVFVASPLIGTVDEDITFPGDGRTLITYIRVDGNKAHGDNAKVSLVYGGLDFNFVTLKFTNRWNRDLNSTVMLYGRPAYNRYP